MVKDAEAWVLDSLTDFQDLLLAGDMLCERTEMRLGMIFRAIRWNQLTRDDNGLDSDFRFGDLESWLSGIINMLETKDSGIFPLRGKGCKCTKCVTLRLKDHLLQPWLGRNRDRGCSCTESFNAGKYGPDANQRGFQHD